MPFKEGTYRHEKGFTVLIRNGAIFVSPDAPKFIDIKDFFDPDKWTRVVLEKG